MAFVPETAYAADYAHLGSAVKDATFTPKDAAGTGATGYAVKVNWDNATTADYAGGKISPASQDSMLVFWKAESGAPDPVSGDKLLVESVAWYVMAVTDSRHGSWRCTVRKAEANT